MLIEIKDNSGFTKYLNPNQIFYIQQWEGTPDTFAVFSVNNVQTHFTFDSGETARECLESIRSELLRYRKGESVKND